MEHIQANSRIRKAFGDFQIIDFNQIDDEAKREKELSKLKSSLMWTPKFGSSLMWPTRPKERMGSRSLVLLVDGDGDKKVNPDMVRSLIERDSRNVVVFITALSPNDELSEKVQLRIRTEDHLLPWEVFRKNVGSELLDSSTTIQEIAVRIVEKCGGHLLAIKIMAKSLKGVKDVHIWELALEKLCYLDREAIVNAFFFNIIWANVIPEREQVRLMRCLKALKSQDSMMSDDPGWVAEDQLFACWFSEQLVDTNEEAEKILQNFMECSILMQFEDIQDRRILLPEDIKTILHALEEEIPENLADGALAPTISNLQVLNLSNTRLRSFCYMPDQIQQLDLEGCMLETLPKAIFKLQKLKALRLDHCSQLLELPQQISELQNLEKLSMEWCKRLETLPQEIGKLQKLNTLLLGHCSQLLELPQQITQLKNLITLSLVWCKRLETLPQDIGKVKSLSRIDLRGTSFLLINENQESNSDYWPLSDSIRIYRGKEATYRSSTSRKAHWDKLVAQVKKEEKEGKLDDAALDKLFWDLCQDYDADDHTKRALRKSFHPVQDLYRLMRIQDFLHVVMSYPVRIGYEDFLKQWINDVLQLRFTSDGPYFYYLERVEDLMHDERPVRYVQAVIPEDITTEIINNGGRFSTETRLKQVPQPILLLASHLALHQFTLTLTSDDVEIQNIWFSVRDDAEKRTVMEHIKANSQIRKAFGDVHIIDFNQIDDEAKREKELSNLKSSLRWNTLVLLVDGDGDKKINPNTVSFPIGRDLRNVVFITTLSPNDELSGNVQLRIRTEDHLLPWEVFRKNVGSELLDSSTTIQEIAVRIVEKCGGHLLAINLMAKSLKGVKDVHVWELALEKLCYRDREAIVNAFFFNIIWANVIPEREQVRLLRCLMVIKYRYWKMNDEGSSFFARWFSEQLVDTEEEAKGILQHFMECSVILQFESNRVPRMLMPEDIKIILQALGEEIPENLSEEAFVSTISDLQVLDLSNTHMRNLYYISPLCKELNLEGCMLETLPKAIFKLHKLETLSLEHCSRLLELPPLITKLQNLKVLRLSGCKRLETQPQEIWELPNLVNCDLSGTHITDLPQFLNFPKLRRLLLGSNRNLMKISSSFFDHMPLLSTLNLSRTSIHELPSSIFNLQKLEELKLNDCELFGVLSPYISKLRSLKTLELEGTLITHLPMEVGRMFNLVRLSLSIYNDSNHDSSFEVIRPGILDKLTYLEVLRIGVNSDNEWWIKNFESILNEISLLSRLQELDLYIPEVKFSAPIKDDLSKFRFIMGRHKPRMISRVPPAIEVMFKESSPSLKFVNGQDFPDKVKTILSVAWAFFLDRHMKINNLTQFGLKNLKHVRLCILAECNEMQSIVDVNGYETDSDLNESICMQFLTIFYMKNLRSIINKPIIGSSIFCKLKLLALHTCPELTTVFTIYSLESLVNLEELIVEDCSKVTSIISCPSFDPTTDFFLPRLRKLSLIFVPELVSISDGVRIGRNLERMGLYYCPKLRSLSPTELSSEKLEVIKGETKWWEALQWSEEDWGQEDPAQKFNQKFSPFDERLDILTQMIPYELMTSFNK